MLSLIDFYADWCGPCKIMDPIFKEIQKDYTGKIDFKKVNVEEDGALAARYGVMGIPTFVILKNEKEVDRRVGAMPKDTLLNWLNSHISK